MLKKSPLPCLQVFYAHNLQLHCNVYTLVLWRVSRALQKQAGPQRKKRCFHNGRPLAVNNLWSHVWLFFTPLPPQSESTATLLRLVEESLHALNARNCQDELFGTALWPLFAEPCSMTWGFASGFQAAGRFQVISRGGVPTPFSF